MHYVRQALALGSIVATVAAIAACGGTTTATKVARATRPAASTVRTDMPLCNAIKFDLTDFSTTADQATNMSDADAEAFVTSTLMPKVLHVESEVGQLQSEATNPSDQRRLGTFQTGLGTIYGGLQALSQGDLSGEQTLSQGVGQMSAGSGITGIAICGSQPTGA